MNTKAKEMNQDGVVMAVSCKDFPSTISELEECSPYQIEKFLEAGAQLALNSHIPSAAKKAHKAILKWNKDNEKLDESEQQDPQEIPDEMSFTFAELFPPTRPVGKIGKKEISAIVGKIASAAADGDLEEVKRLTGLLQA